MEIGNLYRETTGEFNRDWWKKIYNIGGISAWIVLFLGAVEILITILPGGNTVQSTVSDWFALFQQNWFMGLRNLGLLNILITLSGLPIFLALFAGHRRSGVAVFALMLAFSGTVIFLATNRAFPMLALSHQYAAAITQSERLILTAAGQTMLTVGQSHSAGTFLGFSLTEVAAILFAIIMLREKIFSRLNAIVGLAGFSCLLIFEIISSFFTGVTPAVMAFAMIGGILSMLWYALLAFQLHKLSRVNLPD